MFFLRIERLSTNLVCLQCGLKELFDFALLGRRTFRRFDQIEVFAKVIGGIGGLGADRHAELVIRILENRLWPVIVITQHDHWMFQMI